VTDASEIVSTADYDEATWRRYLLGLAFLTCLVGTIYAFVTLNAGEEGSEEVRKELINEVRHDIGGLAAPEVIYFTPVLPKTRSGKIMRRILRKIAEGDVSNLGDTSTLADPGVVDQLVANRPALETAK